AGDVPTDGRGFDTFELKPEVVAHPLQGSSATSPPRDNSHSTRVSIRLFVSSLHPLDGPLNQRPLAVSTVQITPSALPSSLPAPVLDARASQGALSRLESGGGNRGALLADVELPEPEAPPPPEPSLPAPSPARVPDSSLAPAW